MSNTSQHFNPLRAFLLLLIAVTVGSLITSGCSDQVLPPDNEGSDGLKAYRIAYNRVKGEEFDRVASIGDNGEGRKDLQAETAIYSPVVNGYMVGATEDHAFINLIDIETGSIVRQIPRRYGETISKTTVALSPDGKKIAYSVNYDDYWINDDGMSVSTHHIVIVNSDGSSAVEFDIGAARETFIRFSPNGEYIAFFDRTDRTQSRGGELYVARTNGTGVRPIAAVGIIGNDESMMFDWSPDGKKIVYMDMQDYAINIASVDGSGVQTIGTGIHPDWSPDGKKIAYMDLQRKLLAVVNSDGSGEPESLGIAAIQPQWSPDGKKLLYFAVIPDIPTDEQTPIMSVMDMETKQGRVLAEDGFYGYWIE